MNLVVLSHSIVYSTVTKYKYSSTVILSDVGNVLNFAVIHENFEVNETSTGKLKTKYSLCEGVHFFRKLL
jgi:hypothetical protein